MRPFDPALLRLLPSARSHVASLGVLGVLAGALTIGQAFAVTALVIGVIDGRSLTGPIVAVVAVFAGRAVVSALTETTAARAGADVSTRLRELLLHRWLERPADDRPEPGSALTLATEGTTSVEPYVARYLPALISAVVLPVFAIATMAVVDWLSALIVVLTVPLLPVFAALIGRATQDATQRRWRTSASLAGHFLDVVRGLPTLVGYNRARAQVRTIEEVSDKHREATMATLKVAFMSSVALEMLATLSVAIVAVAVGIRLAYGHMALSTGLVAILLSPEAYWPIRRVGAEFHNAADGAAALEQVLAQLAPEPDASAGPTGPAGPSTSTDQTVARLDRVGYRYGGAPGWTIRDLTVQLPVGLTVVTGPSGAGKSTLLELLAGIRRPVTGTLSAPTAHLVTQTPFFTAASVRDNLRLTAPDASDEMILAALTRLHLDDVLAALPQGLDTVLGDSGFGLSAGQRARLAMARALLDESPMILFDEPTAHLDADSVAVAHQAMAQLAAERIVVAVTHRVELAELAGHRLELPGRAGRPDPDPGPAAAVEPDPATAPEVSS